MGSSPIIDLIKEKLDIADVVREYVPSLRKAGRNFKAPCPFHNEKTPSFTVSPDKGIFYCFGCNEGGDVFSFVMKIEGLTFPEAARKLAAKAGVEYGEERSHPMTEADKERQELKKVLAHASGFYHKMLFSPAGEKARLYLGERRLNKATVEKFELGWAPASGTALIEELKERGWSRDLALKAGLISERDDGRVLDAFRGRIIFPILNQSGEPVAFGGRVLDPQGQPKYLNSPETVLFSKRRTLYGLHEALPSIRKSGRLLLLEGYMDVIGAHQHGVDWAVAPLGTAFTAEHASFIGRYAKDTVVMFDDDRAGIQASVRAAEIFMEAGLYVRLASLEGGLDPDEFLNEHGREAFEAKLTEAVDPLTYRINLFFRSRKTPPTAQEKAQAIGVLLETVAKQPDEILKSEWIKALSTRFGVEEDSVLKQLRKAPGAPAQKSRVMGAAPAPADLPPMEKGVLQLLMQQPSLGESASELLPEDFSHPLARRIFEALRSLPPGERGNAAQSLSASFPEDAADIMRLAVSDVGSGADAAQGIVKEIRALKRAALERRARELKAAGNWAEHSKVRTELEALKKQL